MSLRIFALTIALLAPPAASAIGIGGASATSSIVQAALATATPAVPREAAARAHFERAMAEITADLADLVVVTSTTRTPADQERIRLAGYRPHPNSQHLHGLAWDLAASPDVLDVVEARALERGLVPLRMRSPVTGNEYLHVQRYGRLPARLRSTLTAQRPPPRARAMLPPLVTRDLPDFALAAFGAPGLDAFAALPAPGPIAALALPPPRVVPRPLEDAKLDLPRHLLKRKAQGRIVVLLRISPEGEVEDVAVDSSDLPEFEDVVLHQVKRWRFTPPTDGGRPIAALARLPIPIQVR